MKLLNQLKMQDMFATWWSHQMETFSVLLALCAGNSPVTGEFPAQRPVTRSCDVFFYLRLNKRLSKQSWGWWFETSSGSLWRHCNEIWLYLTRCHKNHYTFSKVYIYSTTLDFPILFFSDIPFLYQVLCAAIFQIPTLIARFIGPTWGPARADRTQVVPMLVPWTLLFG